jgi:hypothetical protein
VNCEAPVKATSDITQVWATEKPAATESTPKDVAYTPVATAMDRASRRMRSRTRAMMAIA